MLPGSGGDTCQGLSLGGFPRRFVPVSVNPWCDSVVFLVPVGLPGVDYWELQLVVSMRPLWSVSAGCFEHQHPLAAVPTHLSLVIYSLTVCLLRA